MENVDNIILEHLRAMRADISCIRGDISEVRQRLTGLEFASGDIKRHTGNLYSEHASQNICHDRLTARMEKIERRIELS